MTDNITLQAEEIEALCSIYGSEWRTEESGSYSMDFQFGANKLTFYFTLPITYPSHSSPEFQMLAPYLNTSQKDNLNVLIKDVCNKNIGEAVLFQLIEKIKEFLEDIQSSIFCQSEDLSTEDNENISELKEKIIFNIAHGSVIQDRKSSFQAHVVNIENVEHIKLVIDQLLENKKISQATHNIYAYRIKTSNGTLLHDCEDDGEAQAGSRLLHLLEILDVINVLVVVSRWYGGIHLGPDRFRHINNAARQCLIEAGFVARNNPQ